MATAWVFTLPCSGLVGAAAYALANGIHGTLGVIVILIILAGLAGLIFWRSRSTKVDHNNVYAEWTGTVVPTESEPAAAAS
jgi:PiT family inorganic phosphate transporter